MYYKKIKISKAVLLLLLAVAAVLLFVAFGNRIAASGATLGETGINSSYNIGDVLEIKEAEITAGDLKAAAFPEIVFPDGTARRASSVVLSQAGRHYLVYRATINGKGYNLTKEFTVYKKLVSAGGASLSYGEHELLPGQDGLIVGLPEGSVFEYNKIIDLRGKTREDKLITLDILPSVLQEDDAKRLVIKLTDAHDSKNYIRIRINRSLDEGLAWYNDNYSYTSAAAYNQLYKGWLGGVGGAGDRIFPSEFIGTGSEISFLGGYLGVSDFSFAFDCKDNRAYLVNGNVSKLIIDFDDDFENNAWKGFTTGEVYLSAYAENYSKETFTFMVKDIYGEALEEYDNLLTAPVPQPKIDLQGYSAHDLPLAVVGKPYPVFNGSVDSMYGLETLTVRAYYGYGSSYSHSVAVAGGYFIPVKAGNYTLEYTVADRYQNTSVRLLHIDAVDATGQVQIRAKTPQTDMISTVAGVPVEISGVESVSGGSGNKTVDIIAKNIKTGELAEVNAGKVTLRTAGLWQIIYTATDYLLQTGTFRYGVEVSLGTKPVWQSEKPVMPVYLLTGVSNFIPNVYADDYTSGSLSVVTADISVNLNGNTYYPQNNIFIPEATGAAELIYKAVAAAGGEEIYTYPVEVLEVGSSPAIDSSRYFVPNAYSNSVNGPDYVTLTLNGKNAEIIFAREVLGGNFSLRFAISPDKKAASSLNLYLTGLGDASEQLKLSFIKDGANVKLSINGGAAKQLDYGLGFGTGIGDFDLILTGNTLNVTNNIFSVTHLADGRPFTGFKGGKAAFSIDADYSAGQSGEIQMFIKNICGQPLNDFGEDLRSPYMHFTKAHLNQAKQGSRITLHKTYTSDILSAFSNTTLTVTLGSKPVISEDGVTLTKVDCTRDYVITLSEIGDYRLLYESRDGADNVGRLSFIIKSTDYISPDIKLENTEGNASVGTTVTLPKAVITDNHDEKPKAYITVHTPYGIIVNATETGAFKPEKAGVYSVRYIAIDSHGNVGEAFYTLTVE